MGDTSAALHHHNICCVTRHRATSPYAQIDLRFGDKEQGALQVVVAPVLRFKDVGFNAKVTVEELGTPDMLISGFAPELFGTPLNEEDVLETRVVNKGGLPYYEWCEKHGRL